MAEGLALWSPTHRAKNARWIGHPAFCGAPATLLPYLQIRNGEEEKRRVEERFSVRIIACDGRGFARNSVIMADKERLVFTVDGVQKFHSWTHASLSLMLDHLSTIPTSDYVKELTSFGQSSLQKQVIHILNCEGFWIYALQGLPYVDRGPAEFPDVTDARLLQQQVIHQTRSYLSSLANQQLNTETELLFPDGDHAVRSPALVLHHILTHAFHHKGQIVAMCRELGYPATGTDLNQFE
jgi:uncharacterized damage-inducible protein DinB